MNNRAFSVARLRAMSRKELIQLKRDKRSLALAFLLPFMLLLLFSYALTTDVENIQIAVLDRDQSAESRAFVEAFARSGYFTVRSTPSNERELTEVIDRGSVRVGLVIPERFAADLAAQRGSPVELLLDGSDAKTATVARGYADGIARSYSARVRVGPRDIQPALRAESRVWYNETLDSKVMIVPGLIAVIMSIIAAMLTSLTVAREWERGTMEQLAATPVSRVEVILGKLLPYLVIGVIDVAVAMTVGIFIFGVPFRGSLLLFAGATAIFLFGVLGLGIMISSVLKSQLLATQAAIFATYMPALLFSGFMFTISNMPFVLQLISRVIPASYFVTLSRGVFLKGSDAVVLWPAILGLTLYALFTVTMSIKKFRKELA
ncbi:MAG TPA: ABC transporter permease [Gemmatimonadaceae bacterium]|nr:ABC transporter permease [Gemmatimonadaceae bacterium]